MLGLHLLSASEETVACMSLSRIDGLEYNKKLEKGKGVLLFDNFLYGWTLLMMTMPGWDGILVIMGGWVWLGHWRSG